MKKILSLVLALAMCLCLFAGCTGGDNTTAPSAAAPTVEEAAEYLYAMYKDDNGSVVRRDFKRVAVVMIDSVRFDVTWAVDSADVTIGAVENSQVTIDINEEPAADVTFTLTATVKDAAGNSKTVTFTHSIEAPKASGTQFVDVPAVDTAYKFALVQNNLGKTLYFTGEMSGYYLAMSESPFDAVDVFVEDVDGGQRIYFMKGEVKTYIDIVPRGADQPGKVNVVLTETPTAVYTWDAERCTYTATVEENTWYLGTYNTYNTISASNVSYIENVEVIGDSQFPAGFCTVNITATQVKAPATGTAYKFALVQNNLGQTLYFTGEMSGYYLAMSQNPAEGVNIFVEDVDGGQRIYFMKGEVKTYIDIVPRGADQPGKVNVVLTETPTAVYTWDAERCTYTATVEENTWYLGTYNTYNTISASNVSYIENVEVIGDSQFPAGPYTVDGFMDMQPEFGGNEEPEQPDTPSTDIVIANGSYLLVVDGKAMSSLAADKGYGYLPTVDVTVADGTATGYTANEIIVITNVAGGFTMQDAHGRYIYMSGTYNNFNVSDTMPTEGHIWTATATEGGYIIKNVAKGKSLVYGDGGYTTFGAYEDKSSVVAVIAVAAAETPDEPEKPEDPETPATDADAIITFDSADNRTVMTATQQVWVANGITVTNDQANSTSELKDYVNPVRFYAHTSLTIAYTGMKTIKITCNSESYANSLKDSISGEGVTVTVEGAVVTITFAAAQDSFVIADLVKQVRVDKIEIYK